MTFFRGVLKIIIASFVLWHMSAILLYNLYDFDTVPVLAWLQTHRDIARPYLLVTSQWQRWNLFSPDPLRRVIEMDIDIELNGEWKTMHTVNHHTVSWWQRAAELKIIRRLEEDGLQELQARYVHDYCRTRKLAPGTHMRLRKRWFVIPKHDKTLSREWWNTWRPEWNEDILTETFCPETS